MFEEMDEAACKVLIRKFEGKRSFGWTHYRWDNDT